jgi:uncharacterized protein (TIGR03435 family)
VDRPVVDRTGLIGDFALRFEIQRTVPLSTPASETGVPTGSFDIFTAVREQLGMNLVPRQEPMGFLTIEGVERPTPN